MFDKLKFNNLVLSGSKDIQKAKVQIVRKIIQKLQKLKKLAEKQPENESHKIKLRKCLAIVECVKKLKRFDALTSILLLEKTPDKIVTNALSTPQQVAIAMLASNQIMKSMLVKFRQELGLEEFDLPTLRKTLNEIKHQKFKNQKRKKRKAAFEAADAGQNADKLKKSKKEKPVKAADKTLDAKAQKTKTKQKRQVVEERHQVENVSDEEVKQEVQVNAKNLDIESKTSSAIKAPENVEIKAEAKPQNAKISKANIAKMDTNNLDKQPLEEADLKRNKKMKPEKLAKEKEEKIQHGFVTANNEYASHAKALPKTSKATYTIKKVVDPFFVTPTGENYVAILPIFETNDNSNDSDELNDDGILKETKKIWRENTKSYNGKKRNNFKETKHERPSSFKAATKNEVLHPSWLAKQKERAPVNFQGKRKVFEDDGSNGPKLEKHDEANKLHPSWAAKQKLKPTITAFQGKKIKFDDDA